MPAERRSIMTTSTGSDVGGPDMAQCSVTGQWFAKDELVTFQGRLVCALGKAQLLDTLRTGGRILGELPIPGVWVRTRALLLDCLLLGTGALILTGLLGFLTLQPSDPSIGVATSAFRVVAILAADIVFVVVFVALLHYFFGKTPGKMLTRTTMICLDGSRPRFIRCLSRSLVTFAGWWVFLALAIMSFRSHGSGVLAASGLALALGWHVADGIAALTDRRRRSLHDRICGTLVFEDY